MTRVPDFRISSRASLASAFLGGKSLGEGFFETLFI